MYFYEFESLQKFNFKSLSNFRNAQRLIVHSRQKREFFCRAIKTLVRFFLFSDFAQELKSILQNKKRNRELVLTCRNLLRSLKDGFNRILFVDKQRNTANASSCGYDNPSLIKPRFFSPIKFGSKLKNTACLSKSWGLS